MVFSFGFTIFRGALSTKSGMNVTPVDGTEPLLSVRVRSSILANEMKTASPRYCITLQCLETGVLSNIHVEDNAARTPIHSPSWRFRLIVVGVRPLGGML